MHGFWATLIITVLLVALALALLSIGLLLTGRPRVKGGMCGRFPKEKNKPLDETCGKKEVCPLCQRENLPDQTGQANPEQEESNQDDST